MKKYHINPETGNPGVCRANIQECRFKMAPDEHFDTKEEARANYERVMATHELRTRLADEWESRQLMTARLDELFELRGKGGDDLAEEREMLYEKLDDQSSKIAYLRDEINGQAPKHVIDFPNTIGLQGAQQEVVDSQNQGVYARFDSMAVPNLGRTMTRYYNGEVPQHEDHWKLVLKEDKLLKALRAKDDDANLKLALIFPEKNLKPVLERLGVQDVLVSSFDNAREYGLVYTVLTPSGNTRSFSVYEHRNTDNVIINGLTNWNKKSSPWGPYAADSKDTYFASFRYDTDHDEVAEKLGGYLKEAQAGTLPTDTELIKLESE